ncbi:hypothetical protein [Microbulbifer agarilyticus]|nr:hypothetical protein [Microbulbifer agarilyticus]
MISAAGETVYAAEVEKLLIHYSAFSGTLVIGLGTRMSDRWWLR